MPDGKNPNPKLSGSLYRLLSDNKVVNAFIDWCEAKNVLDIMDLALLCPDEKSVDDKIFKLCQTDVTTVLTDIAIAGPIRKSWHLARKAMDSGKQIQELKALDEEKAVCLDSLWNAAHSHVLAPNRRVGESLMTKLLQIVVSSPPKFPVIPLDKITIESFASNTVQNLVKADGGSSVNVASDEARKRQLIRRFNWETHERKLGFGAALLLILI